MPDTETLVAARQTRDLPAGERAPFEFRHLVDYTGVAKNLVRHWVDAGIIAPSVAADGTGTRRFFHLRELVIVKVCDWLHRFGLGEEELRYVASSIAIMWFAFTVDALKASGRTVLWIRISARAAERHDARLQATTRRAAPEIDLATLPEVLDQLQKGYAGIVIDLGPIIAAIEKKTGERLT